MFEKRPLSRRVLVGAGLIVAALSCGEVPTLPDGIAYITSVLLPSPAVAVGDTLRDSTGKATPIRIYGIGNKGDTIAGVTPTFVVTTVPGKSVHITDAGYVIGDSVRTAQIVGQVGTRLQTPPVPIDVVRQPDSIAASTAGPVKLPDPVGKEVLVTSGPLQVTVMSGAAKTAVKSIIVRYRVARWFPATFTFPDTSLVLLDDNGHTQGPDGRSATDTTDASGSASRKVRTLSLGFDSLEITASANNLKGVPLRGSPVHFIVTTK
jgi:hypothetical protein